MKKSSENGKKEQVPKNEREQGERGKMSKGAGNIDTPLTEPQNMVKIWIPSQYEVGAISEVNGISGTVTPASQEYTVSQESILGIL